MLLAAAALRQLSSYWTLSSDTGACKARARLALVKALRPALTQTTDTLVIVTVLEATLRVPAIVVFKLC